MANKSRILSLILAVSILLSFSLWNTASAQPVDYVGESAFDLLTRLGVEVKNENTKLTRMEFASAVLQLVKQYETGTDIDNSYFFDVQGVSSGVVNRAVDLGYFKKSADGMFRPNDTLTYEEAIVVAVRVLGYEYAAGDTYSFAKYYNIARSKDLTDDVDSNDFDAVSVNILLVNMLNTECADTIYAQNKIELSSETLIESIYGITHYVGKVEAINGVSVTGAHSADNGKVVIDGNVYNTDDEFSTYEFLGNTADCYMTEINGSAKLFAMYKYEEGTVLELTGDDISSVADDLSQIRYYKGDSVKTARISEDVSVVYNNTKKFNVSKKDFSGENVRLILTDGDSDGTYDTIVAENPLYYKVATVDAKDLYISSENNQPVIEPENLVSEDLFEVVRSDGTTASLGEVKKGVYVEVLLSKDKAGAIDYTKNITIVILTETVSGVIDSVGDDFVSVEGREYSYVSDIAGELSIGKSATFYIGSNGKLIGISDVLPDSNTYGYLVGVKKQTGLSDSVTAKIFSQNGEMKLYDTADRVNYTGYIGTQYVEKTNIDAVKLIDYITDGQLVKFYADANGILQKIVCAYDYTGDYDYEGCDDSKFTLEYHNSRGSFYNLVASENHYYDNNSIIFSVPESGLDRDYSVGPYTAYPEINNVDIKLYDSDAGFICRVGVMVTTSTFAAEFTNEELGDQNIAVISKKIRKIEGEEEVVGFKAYYLSKEVTLVAKRDDLHDANISMPSQGEKSKIYFNELNPGDVIQYKTDGEGKVILLNVLHRFDKNDTSSKYFTLQPDVAHLSLMITQTGLVEKYKADGFFTIADSDGKKYNFSDKRIMYHIYIYDVNTGDVEAVNPLTYLKSIDSDEPDYVFVKCRRTSLRDLVVYRYR